MDVLNTKANPLLEVFNSVFGNVEACTPFKPQDYDTLTMDLLLAQYHNDLKQIEQTLRGVFKSRSGLTKRMKKIQGYIEGKRASTDKQMNTLQDVRNLLL